MGTEVFEQYLELKADKESLEEEYNDLWYQFKELTEWVEQQAMKAGSWNEYVAYVSVLKEINPAYDVKRLKDRK